MFRADFPRIAIAALLAAGAPLASGQATSFTYQGLLHDAGEPLDGPVDLEFTVFDAAAGGNEVSVDLTANAVPVVDGVFTVDLDFGSGVFTGSDRWLQIAVASPAGSGAFTTLSPRQPVTAAPVALYALDGPGGGVSPWEFNGGDLFYDGGRVGIGTDTPGAPLDVAGQVRSNGPGAAFQIFNPNNPGAAAHFSWLNDRARIRIGGSGPGANGGFSIQRIGDQTLFRVTDNRRCGIIEDDPLVELHVTGESNGLLSSALENDEIVVEAQDAVMGLYSTAQGNWGSAIALKEVSGGAIVDTWGIARKTTAAGSGLFFTFGTDENYAANPGVMTLTDDRRVGIGTTSPATQLDVRGTGSAFGNHLAYFENTGSNNADGLAIKINNPNTNRHNNFVTFIDGQDNVAGRIEGFDLANGDWVPPPPLPSFGLEIDLGITPRPVADWFDPGNVVPVATLSGGSPPDLDVTMCPIVGGLEVVCGVEIVPGQFPTVNIQATPPSITGLPFIFSTPSISVTLPTQQEIDALICWAEEHDLLGLIHLDPLAGHAAALGMLAARNCRDGGVVYGSKGADYAEYLEKANPEDDLRFGEVVGVFGGKITRRTDGAEQVMVVSRAPAMVGNLPAEGELERFEKVAFMGQVPVVTRGPVAQGDYLVPSGAHDGVAIAVAPEELTVADLSGVIGRAWSSSDGRGLDFVTVVVGVRDEAAGHVVGRQARRLDAQARRIDAQAARLAALEGQLAALVGALDGGAGDAALAEGLR